MFSTKIKRKIVLKRDEKTKKKLLKIKEKV